MAKKKKNEKKKKLKSLILLLFLTIILLSTSTYAWFTSNRSVSIDPIDVNVAASSGLMISTDASDWKTVISNTDIINPGEFSGHKNMLPYNLVPVSTAGVVSSGYMQFFEGVIEADENNNNTMSLTATATGSEASYVYTLDAQNKRVYPSNVDNPPKFIAFDIFLKNDATEDVDVYLTNGSGVVPTSTVDKGLQNAARYAFVKEGSGIASTDPATARSWIAGNSSIVVEPNFDMHTATGALAASTTYGQSTTADTADTTALPYLGVKSAISTPIALINTNPGGTASGDYFQSITNLVLTNNAYSENASGRKSYTGTSTAANMDAKLHKIFTLEPGVTKYRVYMWVEGQDVDCENSASGANLTYSIGFSLDEE